MKRIVLAFLILLMSVSLALADTIFLRDGRQVRGTFLGFIGGRFVMRVSNPTTQPSRAGAARTTDEEGEIQFFRPRDVERIEIDGRSLDEARFVTRNVEVSLGPNWIDTGVDVRRGQRVQVRADGTIFIGRRRVTPDGLRSRPDPAAPMPSAAEGALIGAIGADLNSPIIEIGLSREFMADRDGRLYLTINRGSMADVTGAYNAQIRVERGLPQRGRAVAGAGRDDDDDDELFDAFGTGRRDPAPVRSRTPSGQISSVAAPEAREVTIDVPANSRGTDTGIDLRAGDQVTITATGTIVTGARSGAVGPEGGRVGLGSIVGTYPVPNVGVGALVGYIRTTAGQIQGPLVVGRQQSFAAPADGRLFLLINDDNYGDNSGSFNVRIRQMSQALGGGGAFGDPREVTIDVPGNSRGTDTGVDLQAGDQVTITATGSVFVGQREGAVPPEGGRIVPSVPVTNAGIGALIGFLRTPRGQNSQPFVVGNRAIFTSPADGRLFLFVNDDIHSDNTGSFRVAIRH